MINVLLLRKTLEYARAHPDEVDLSRWAGVTDCGTTACLAGTAAILAGHTIDWLQADCNGNVSYTTDGRHIEYVARDELGLHRSESDILFYCDSLAQAWEVAEELTDGEIQPPPR